MTYLGEGSQFFEDQHVFKDDLNNIEYTKTKMIRDSVMAVTAQYGVCSTSLDSTLQVSLPNSGSFTVAPGRGIDPYGRLITVPTAVTVSGSFVNDPYYHPAWPQRVAIPHSKIPPSIALYYVNIKYDTQWAGSEINDVGVQYYTRAYDSYAIELNSSPSINGLTLASFYIDKNGIVTNLVDRRTLYAANDGNTTHQTFYHKNGIGDNPPPNYTAGFQEAVTQGSLGMTMVQYGLSTSVSFNNIETNSYANINGKTLRGALEESTKSLTFSSTGDSQGNYIIYMDKLKYIHKSTVNDYTAASASTVLPLFHVKWTSRSPTNYVFTIEQDLRHWSTSPDRIEGVHFTSGSLVLNSGSIGEHSTQIHPAVYFSDQNKAIMYNSNVPEYQIHGGTVTQKGSGFDLKAEGNLHVKSGAVASDAFVYLTGDGTYISKREASGTIDINTPIKVLPSGSSLGETRIDGPLVLGSDLYFGGGGYKTSVLPADFQLVYPGSLTSQHPVFGDGSNTGMTFTLSPGVWHISYHLPLIGNRNSSAFAEVAPSWQGGWFWMENASIVIPSSGVTKATPEGGFDPSAGSYTVTHSFIHVVTTATTYRLVSRPRGQATTQYIAGSNLDDTGERANLTAFRVQ